MWVWLISSIRCLYQKCPNIKRLSIIKCWEFWMDSNNWTHQQWHLFTGRGIHCFLQVQRRQLGNAFCQTLIYRSNSTGPFLSHSLLRIYKIWFLFFRSSRTHTINQSMFYQERNHRNLSLEYSWLSFFNSIFNRMLFGSFFSCARISHSTNQSRGILFSSHSISSVFFFQLFSLLFDDFVWTLVLIWIKVTQIRSYLWHAQRTTLSHTHTHIRR